jgi:hypothetical protein
MRRLESRTFSAVAPNARPGIRPPERSLKRSVVATRPPRTGLGRALTRESNTWQAGVTGPPHRVGVPKKREPGPALPRLPFGHGTVERPMSDRAHAPAPLKLKGPQRAKELSKTGPSATRRASPQSRREPQVTRPATAVSQPQARRPESLHPQARRLPGEPANQISANWVKVQEESSTSSRQHSKVRRKPGFGRGESEGG